MCDAQNTSAIFSSSKWKNFDRSLSTMNESYQELKLKHTLVYPEYIYISGWLNASFCAQSSLTKTHPPGADSSSLSSTQKFYCLHPYQLRYSPILMNSPRRRESRGHYESRSEYDLEVTQSRTAVFRCHLTRSIRVLESPACPAPCTARGHGTSGGRPVSRSPRESHTVEEEEVEEEEGCPKRCTESNCWRELSTGDAVYSILGLLQPPVSPPHHDWRVQDEPCRPGPGL